jgi:hypothetical protein
MSDKNRSMKLTERSVRSLAETQRQRRGHLSPLVEMRRRTFDFFQPQPYIVTEVQGKDSIFGPNENVFIDCTYGAGSDTGAKSTAGMKAVFSAIPYDAETDLTDHREIGQQITPFSTLNTDPVKIASRFISGTLFTGSLFMAGYVTGFGISELGSERGGDLAKDEDIPVGDVLAGPFGHRWAGTVTTEPSLTQEETLRNIVCVDVNYFPRFYNDKATTTTRGQTRVFSCRVKALNDTGTKLKDGQQVIADLMAPGFQYFPINIIQSYSYAIRWRISEYRCP